NELSALPFGSPGLDNFWRMGRIEMRLGLNFNPAAGEDVRPLASRDLRLPPTAVLEQWIELWKAFAPLNAVRNARIGWSAIACRFPNRRGSTQSTVWDCGPWRMCGPAPAPARAAPPAISYSSNT